jgi:serine/threonine protein kinase
MGPLESGVTLVDGRYRLTERLGAGGMASVWLARDATLGRDVAVKFIADTLAADAVWHRRFEREARAAARVNHPNVVSIFDMGTERGRPFLVMSYVPGGSLADRLRDSGKAALDGDRLARQLLGALECIHAAGLLHRDIKPANVLLDAAGDAHITDFGIALPDDATQLTRPGHVLGTARYLAPEVAAGQPASRRSDLYACGVLLRDAVGERASRSLRGLIAALTEPDPDRRPANAGEAHARLDAPSTTGVAEPISERVTHVLTDVPTRARTAATGIMTTRTERIDGRAPVRSCTLGPRAVTAGLLAVAAVIGLVIVLGSGGGGNGGATTAVPRPAAPDAPLDQQLRALDARVRYAARER